MRQRRHVVEGRERTVCTPGMFRNGADWRGWAYGGEPADEEVPAGVLSVQREGDLAAVRFDPVSPGHQDLRVYLAVLGMNLETRVGAGENRGRTLRHDFVVLGLASVALAPTRDGFVASAQLPGTGEPGGERAFAAWVSRRGSQLPLQAVGGCL